MKVTLIGYVGNGNVIMGVAAKTCYSSLGPSEISQKLLTLDDLQKNNNLVQKVLDSGHLSIAEHVNFTFAIEGISRSCSHQLVRHRHCTFCLDEDTKIYRYSTNGKHDYTIKELYERWNTSCYKGSLTQIQLRSANTNNILVPNYIENIIDCGVQPVYNIKTSLGYSLNCTLNHKLFSKQGEVKLKDLKIGDKVLVNGLELYKDKEWFEQKYCNEHLSTKQIAALCGIKQVTARVWKTKHGIPNDNTFKKREFSEETKLKLSKSHKGKIFNSRTKKLLSQQKLGDKNPQFKALRDVGEGQLRKEHRKVKLNKCQLCGCTQTMLHIHHIDKNIKNTHPSNALTVCPSCHALIHGKKKTKKVIEDVIIEINYVGEKQTYDIEMKAPYHNFVANGFLVHNSQQSQRYVEIKEDYNALIDLRDKEFKTTEEEKYLMEICKRYFVDVTANNYKQYLDALITYLYEVQINKNKPEDARQFLPNATKTNIVMTCNLRELMHIANLRLCTRAQKEIRTLVRNMCDEVIKIPGYEWLDKYLQPKCKINGFCDEHNSCGFKIKKEDIFKLLKINTVESKINEI